MRGKTWGSEGAEEGSTPKKKKNDSCESSGKVSSSSEGNHIWFYQDVSSESTQALGALLQETSSRLRKDTAWFNLNNGVEVEPPPIHLHIHSYGGSVFAGFAAADAILGCQSPVHTHIEGGTASAATLMSIMGAHRTIGPNAFMLIHQLSSVAWGNYEQLKDEMKNNKLLMERIRAVYVQRTKMTKRQVADILKKDLWFDAAKCLKFGLVDAIR